MSRFQECLQPQGPRAILISIKPRFAEQILTGAKTVEFRRVWAVEPVGLAVIYSSSPVKRLVGVVEVDGAVVASPSTVWIRCSSRGPGLQRKELMEYFAGKAKAYGVLLGEVALPKKPVAPKSLFKDFRPPQSYRYLSTTELRRVGKQFGLIEEAE
ncbi:ASCH domain-containing protein [Variovorax sp. N23]|uniref:ASCH domain-containing protein n=1 Tax=Variovorax sp. N23 TaxID=2980555 RepID=UPI0021C6B51E|nr:ASCH domain-containing protein [Variovorax sp. N23]MCU4120995.1 ASCH domain-containing protein [Variovorax sp. N23]